MNLHPVDPMRRRLFDTRHAVAILDTLGLATLVSAGLDMARHNN